MANAIATLKVMPTSPEVDLETKKEEILGKIKETVGDTETKTEIKPVAFGLKSLEIIFVMDESLGSPDNIASDVAEMEEIQSAEITDVRRAVG